MYPLFPYPLLPPPKEFGFQHLPSWTNDSLCITRACVAPSGACTDITAIGYYVMGLACLNLLLIFGLVVFIFLTVIKRSCGGVPLCNSSGSTLLSSIIGCSGVTVWFSDFIKPQLTGTFTRARFTVTCRRRPCVCHVYCSPPLTVRHDSVPSLLFTSPSFSFSILSFPRPSVQRSGSTAAIRYTLPIGLTMGTNFFCIATLTIALYWIQVIR